MYSIEHLDLALASETEIRKNLALVASGDFIALRLISSDEQIVPFNVMQKQAKAVLELPWLPKDIADAPLGGTQLAGAGHAEDMPAHIDSGDETVINVHATQNGMLLATFIPGLHNGYFNENGDLNVAVEKLPNQNIYPESIEVAAGDVLCFCGGAVAHQFISLTPNRRSYVRLFRTSEEQFMNAL